MASPPSMLRTMSTIDASRDNKNGELTKRGPCMRGVMAQPCRGNPNVLLFASYADGNDCALVFVAGLAQGMLSLPWLPQFAQAVDRVGFATIQVNLSSSFGSCGMSSLQQDSRELEMVVRYLRKEMRMKRVVLAGHSTGSQDIVSYLRHIGESPDPEASIDGAILISGISDREAFSLMNGVVVKHLVDEALRLVEKGEPDSVLPERLLGCHFTARRLLSLTERLGDDDMFSTDLTEEELTRILAPLTIPCIFIYGEQDEFVPDMDRLRSFANVMLSVVKKRSPRADVLFIPGNHDFEAEADSPAMISTACKFLEQFAA
ncbi:hydrolase family or acyltransferase protein [Cystoisospora suis]|uniref:Hydrolase family or acyltransferase protein n=1 Tax=Cystoisospora suis TaxID=483139 RepID=A0A2C6L6H1_9APIC|nr:hydrolase family or acyltransferase protein [Cystoisospora suis]